MRSLKGRRKKRYVRNKTIKCLAIFNVIAFFIVITAIELIDWEIEIINKYKSVTISIVVILNLILLIVLIIFFKEKFEICRSERYVEIFLGTNVGREVELIKARDYKDFIMNLNHISRFYAVINEEKNCVDIEISFNNEIDSMPFESISKKRFMRYYKLK